MKLRLRKKPLTKRQMDRLVRQHQKWLNRPDIQRLRRAVEQSRQIPTEDWLKRIC